MIIKHVTLYVRATLLSFFLLEQHFNKNGNMCCGHELRRYCTKPNRSGINRNHSKLQKC